MIASTSGRRLIDGRQQLAHVRGCECLRQRRTPGIADGRHRLGQAPVDDAVQVQKADEASRGRRGPPGGAWRVAPGAIDDKPAKHLAGQLPKVQLTAGRQEGEQLNISHRAFARRRRCTPRDPQVLGERVEDVIKAVKCGCTEHGSSLFRHGMWRQVAHDYADPDHSGHCDPARTIRDAIEREHAYSAERGRAHKAAILGLHLHDHLIAGEGGQYFSFRETGLLRTGLEEIVAACGARPTHAQPTTRS